MTRARGTEHPCPGCGQVVAYKYAVQYRGNGGKARARHRCPHGEACIFGEGPSYGQGFNWPRCKACLADRKREYAERRASSRDS